MTRSLVVLAAVGCVLAGCNRDLSLPDEPGRGILDGAVDTQGHGSVAGINLTLIKPTGARVTTVTAPDGTFVFDDLEPGQHILELKGLNGFAPLTEFATVIAGQKVSFGTLRPIYLAGATGDLEAPTGTLTVTGTLGDGTASTAFTTKGQVTITLAVAGGPVEYLLSLDALTTCPATGYAPMPSGNTLTRVLPAPGTHTLKLCMRDSVGNTSPVIAANAIVYDTTAPSGCTLTLTGKKVDGTAAPAGKTGQRLVSAATAQCAETPAQLVLSLDSGLSCTNTAPNEWLPFSASRLLVLSGADGPTTVRGCVRDLAGNVSSIAQASIELDTTPPLLPQVSILNGAAFLNLATGTTNIQVRGTAVGASEWAVVEGAATPSSFVDYVTANPASVSFPGAAGTRRVNALFKDDVGNVSALASDTIELDVTAPAAMLSIRTPSGNAFTNSVSIDVNVDSLSPDVKELLLVRGGNGPCSDADLAAATAVPFTRTSTLLLSTAGGDGLRRVCAQVKDQAGNPSAILEGTVTLDTTPPTEPKIVTLPQFRKIGEPLAFTVTTQGPSSDLNFDRYDAVGGTISGWQSVSTNAATTTFMFTLQTDATKPGGLPNLLRLRAVDKAGNVSAESSVTITTDIVAPASPTLSRFGIDNRNDESVIYWSPSSSNDLAGYRVYYGRAMRQAGEPLSLYDGAYATQGASPFLVPANIRKAPLSGLTNGTTTFATVTAVDLAGNESAEDINAAPALLLQPNALSPSTIADLQLPMTAAHELLIDQDKAWVAGVSCAAGNNNVVVSLVALGGITAPYQRGTLGTGVAPVIVGSSSFAIGACPGPTQRVRLALEGPMLFVTVGDSVGVHRIVPGPLPTVTNRLALLNPGIGALNSLHVEGPVLFAGRANEVAAYNLRTLYDNVAGQTLSLLGAPGNAAFSGTEQASLVVTKNRLLTFFPGSPSLGLWDSTSGYGGASWSSANILGPGSGTFQLDVGTFNGVEGAPAVSGDLLYLGSDFGLTVAKLNNVWAGGSPTAINPPYLPILATATAATTGKLELTPEFAWSPERASHTIRALGLSRLLSGQIDQAAVFDPGNLTSPDGPTATASWGNYQLIATSNGRLIVAEISSASAMRVTNRAPSLGGKSELSGAFLISQYLSVLDLQSGPSVVDRGTRTLECNVHDFALFGEQRVDGRSGTPEQLRVFNLEAAVDRDPGTNFDTPAFYDVTFGPANMQVLATEAWGNYLVMIEDRAAAGVWLEVLDMTAVRDRLPGTQLNAATARRGEVRLGNFVTSTSGTGLLADVKISNGRAVVGIDEFSGGVVDPNPGLFVVDLRNAVDDVPGNNPTVLGTLPATGVRSVSVNGNLAWLAAQLNNGGTVESWDIGPALQEPPQPLTATQPSSRRGTGVEHPESIVSRGGWTFYSAAGNFTPGVTVLDTSVAGAPRVVSFVPEATTTEGCNEVLPGTHQLHQTGNRLYLSSGNATTFFELE